MLRFIKSPIGQFFSALIILICGIAFGLAVNDSIDSHSIGLATQILSGVGTLLLAAIALYGLWAWRHEYELKRVATAAERYLFSFHPYYSSALEAYLYLLEEDKVVGIPGTSDTCEILMRRLIKVQENIRINAALAGLISTELAKLQSAANNCIQDAYECLNYDENFYIKAEEAIEKCQAIVHKLAVHIRLEG